MFNKLTEKQKKIIKCVIIFQGGLSYPDPYSIEDIFPGGKNIVYLKVHLRNRNWYVKFDLKQFKTLTGLYTEIKYCKAEWAIK